MQLSRNGCMGLKPPFPCTGITVTNHPMNKTSASLSLDYL